MNPEVSDAIALLEREGFRVTRASTPAERAAAWVHLYQRDTGICFRPLAPDADLISLDTISHGLSLENRFGCQTRYFYPVAMHCFRGSYAFDDPNDAIDFLFHDTAEGLGLRDIPAPLRRLPEMSFYVEIERSIMGAVAARHRLRDDFWERPRIKAVDELMLHHESAELLVPLPPDVPGWTRKLSPAETIRIPACGGAVDPTYAKKVWLLRLAELGDVAGREDLAERARLVLAADQRTEMGLQQ